jgi:hypothetical protein
MMITIPVVEHIIQIFIGLVNQMGYLSIIPQETLNGVYHQYWMGLVYYQENHLV